VKTYDVRAITEEYMNDRLARTTNYTLMILHTTEKTFTAEGRPIIWEHGRRNMALREDGVLAIVTPATDGGDVAGIGIFNAQTDEVTEIMDADPAVEAGVLTYELHPIRGFPGDCLPERSGE
jgi:YCII-related domain-containing protein